MAVAVNVSNLKQRRTETGLTQAELAEKADISIRVLQNYESGHRSINKAQALIVWKLAEALGCTVGDSLENE